MRFANRRDSKSTRLILVNPRKITLWCNGKGDRWLDDNAEFRGSLDPLLLRRVRPEHNERRFYALAIAADLFGNVVLLRHWGRIGSGGKQRTDHHSDFVRAAQSFEQIAQEKRRRGYVDQGF